MDLQCPIKAVAINQSINMRAHSDVGDVPLHVGDVPLHMHAHSDVGDVPLHMHAHSDIGDMPLHMHAQ